MSQDNVMQLAAFRAAGAALKASPQRDDMLHAFLSLSADIGSDKLFAVLLPQFITELETRLRKIDRALAAGDCETIRHHAGILKDSAARMQLPYFSDLLDQLEQHAGRMALPTPAFTQHFARTSEFIYTELLEHLSA